MSRNFGLPDKSCAASRRPRKRRKTLIVKEPEAHGDNFPHLSIGSPIGRERKPRPEKSNLGGLIIVLTAALIATAASFYGCLLAIR